MKNTSRFIVSALVASASLTFSVPAQAGLFDALLAIPRMAYNLASLTVMLPIKIDELLTTLFIDMLSSPATEVNAQRSSDFASLEGYNQQSKQNSNETTSQLVQEIFQGLDEFQTRLNIYKMPAKYGDCSDPNSPNCYSALNITTVNGTDTITNPSQQQAAKSYSTFAAGGGSTLPAPDPNWTPTPQVIAYTNSYRTNTAAQSAQVDHISNTLASRLPADKDQSNVSAYEFNKNTTYKANVSGKAGGSQDVLSKIPVIGWIYSIAHGVTSMVTITSHGLDQLDNLSNMTSANTSALTQTQNQLSGRQMYHDAVASQGGEPNKKNPQ